MPADFGTDLRLARLYFRRVCTVSVTVDSVTTRELSLERLRAYSEQVMGCAMEEVLVLSSSFEGGSAQGQAKFDKRAAAIALEELLLEADPDQPREVTQTQAAFQRVTDSNGYFTA